MNNGGYSHIKSGAMNIDETCFWSRRFGIGTNLLNTNAVRSITYIKPTMKQTSLSHTQSALNFYIYDITLAQNSLWITEVPLVMLLLL